MSQYDPNQGGPPPGHDYPGMAPPPSQPGPPAPAGAPPQQLRLAVNLSFILVALALLGVILGFTQRDAAIEAAQNANTSGLSQSQIETAVTATLTVFAVITAILSVLFVWFAIMARKGANWARIVMTVLLAIWLLFTLIGVFGNGLALGRVIQAIELILQIAILILLWQRPSSEYFQARARGARAY